MLEAQLQLLIQHWYARGTFVIVDSILVCQKHSCNCVFNTGMLEAQLLLVCQRHNCNCGFNTGMAEAQLQLQLLVNKLKKIVGSNNFSAQFIKIISHYKKIGYNINVLQQTACLVVNPITVGNFAFLFNCTPVGRTSDSMMVPT